MSVVIPHRTVEAIASAKDPKAAIIKAAGDLSDIEIIGDMVLVGIYIRPEKTKGGIWLTDNAKQEDVFQGKVGLVLKWGPDAFMGEDGVRFDQTVAVGEWCVYKVGDGWQFSLRDTPCRLVRDTSIKLKVKDPNIIL